MRTNYTKKVGTGIVLLLTMTLFMNNSFAQEEPKKGFDAEEILVVRIGDTENQEKPQKVIMVYEDRSLTYELSEDGIFTLQSTTSNTRLVKTEAYSETGNSEFEQESLKLMGEVLKESYINEEEQNLEAWMLSPSEWI